MSRTCLMVFAKAPEPGKVKTRLAKRYGKRGAARLYRQMLLHQLSRLQEIQGLDTVLFCSPGTAHPFFHHCRRKYGIRLVPQAGGDLGNRMFLAFRWCLKRYDQGILVGSDLPELDIRVIQDLVKHEPGKHVISLVPSDDGGYVLIVQQENHARLFRCMHWSTPQVFRKTRQRILQQGLQCSLHEPCPDVDTPSDIRRIRQRGIVRGYP